MNFEELRNKDENRQVACLKCVQSYRLSGSLLGRHKEKCYWCCKIIFDEDMMKKIAMQSQINYLKLLIKATRRGR